MLASLFSGHCGDHLFPGEIWRGFCSLDAQPAILDIFTPCPVKAGTAVLINPPQVFLNCFHFLLMFPREEITSKKRWFFLVYLYHISNRKVVKGLYTLLLLTFSKVFENTRNSGKWLTIGDPAKLLFGNSKIGSAFFPLKNWSKHVCLTIQRLKMR